MYNIMLIYYKQISTMKKYKRYEIIESNGIMCYCSICSLKVELRKKQLSRKSEQSGGASCANILGEKK